MATDAALKDGSSESNHASQSPSEKPPKKKKSLTRLFTASRSSSKSRAQSVEDLALPSTPTIPDQFLSSSRKASNCEAPPAASSGVNNSAEAELPDVTNKSGLSVDQPDARRSGLRGRLKQMPSAANVHSNACHQVSSNDLIKSRSQTLNGTHKCRKEKPTVYPSPTFPDVGKATNNNVKSSSSISPRPRSRGASVAWHGVPPPLDTHFASDVLSRPATSVGERSVRRARNTVSGNGGRQGLGQSLDPFSEPIQFDEEQIRTSFRSAMTTTSSLVNPSTARSSVVTKDTSMTDVTLESPPNDAGEEGMTVDEAIGMYENGFVDDEASDQDNPSASSISEEERRRSRKIAEAINDTIGPDMEPSVLSSISASFETDTVTAGTAHEGGPHRAPAIMLPTTTRDQYGFLKANRYITVEQYDAWNRIYTTDQLRRSKKWVTYMREQGCSPYAPVQFPDRAPKTLRYIRKGIPPAWRGAAWFYYSGGARLLKENPETYSTLISRSKTSELSSTDNESIERDLHRTFPDNIHFKPEQPDVGGSETALLASLRRVLRAFAVYRPQIGYCQSLNFLVGLLLLFLPEEKTFWMLHIITTDHLPGTHELSLEGANVDLWVLMFALKESNPSIWAKVGVGGEDVGNIHAVRLPPISLCTTTWFMSMFIGTLPIESVLRVWDVIFYEGSKMLFRIALAIFKMGEQRIRDVNDSMELFQVVQALPREFLDIGALMGVACRRGGISQEWITKKRKDRRKWYAKEKAKAAGSATPTGTGDSPVGEGSPDLSRANSAWRRRVGLGK
ncbi:MAG: hypothetical protein Q9201_000760 [Fulgogasparrea decipioides]